MEEWSGAFEVCGRPQVNLALYSPSFVRSPLFPVEKTNGKVTLARLVPRHMGVDASDGLLGIGRKSEKLPILDLQDEYLALGFQVSKADA